MTARRAPIEVLERMAEIAAETWEGVADEQLPSVVRATVSAYRAATTPLRTRAEVDAEIATLVRDYHRHITRPGWKKLPDWDSFSTEQTNDLNRLCSEPTRDE